MGGRNDNSAFAAAAAAAPAAASKPPVLNKHALVTGMMLSSAVPGRAKSDAGEREEKDRRDLTGLDLAMKLHYLRGVYFFDRKATAGMTIVDLKPPFFDCLELYRDVSGRIRVPADDDDGCCSGLPFITINDSGVRLVEARCDGMTVEEWLKMDGCCGLTDELLVYNHVLGPDLHFSPLVFIQITWFKCGGISVGLTWAHLLGDALSASAFVNKLGQYIRSEKPPCEPLRIHEQPPPASTVAAHRRQPMCLKPVDPVNTHWTAAAQADTRTSSHSFHFTPQQIERLRGNHDQIGTFELVSAVMWRSIAKIRKHQEEEPRTVTVCKHNQSKREHLAPFNGCVITVAELVAPHPPPSESDVADLAAALVSSGDANDESGEIREFVERERGLDFVMYGANLTFVDLEGAELYGFVVNERKPLFANYTIGGVAGGSAVLVLPGPEEKTGEVSRGRMVTVMLADEEIKGLKWELKHVLELEEGA